MDSNKDYYAILGVTPFAEEIVIRAAYKALAQRYHPDRHAGDKNEAHRKMAELNEAYGVLSDPVKRKEYDELRANGTQDAESYFGEEKSEAPPPFDPLEKDWDVALEYYPDLEEIEHKLRRVSWRLSYSYKAYLLDEKQFEQRAGLANQFELQFLQTYFGSNQEIIKFARMLIESGMRKAALELNEAIRVLGSGVTPERVIFKISKKYAFEVPDHPSLSAEIERLIQKINKLEPADGQQLKLDLIQALGGRFAWNGVFSSKCSVDIYRKHYEFGNEREFAEWVSREFLPLLAKRWGQF